MRLCGIWGCNILSESVGFFLSSSFHSCTELCKIGWSQGKPRVRRRKKSPLSPAFVFLFSSWKEHESQDLKDMAEIRDNQLICFYPKAEFTAAKFHWSVDPLLRGDYLVQEDELFGHKLPGSRLNSLGQLVAGQERPRLTPAAPETEQLPVLAGPCRAALGRALRLFVPQFLSVQWGMMALSSAFGFCSERYLKSHLSPPIVTQQPVEWGQN